MLLHWNKKKGKKVPHDRGERELERSQILRGQVSIDEAYSRLVSYYPSC